jgi:hypothetical protein
MPLHYVSRGNSIGPYSDHFPPVETIEEARDLVRQLEDDGEQGIIWINAWDEEIEEYVPLMVE